MGLVGSAPYITTAVCVTTVQTNHSVEYVVKLHSSTHGITYFIKLNSKAYALYLTL